MNAFLTLAWTVWTLKINNGFDSAEQVLVIPQPCYTSTRIRVLKLVRNKGEYEKFKDCIVLPSQTEAPVVANKYFVCWDEKLTLQPDSSHIAKVFSGISSQISRLPVFSCSCSPEATRDKVGETVLSQKDVEADSPSTAGKLHSFQEADRPSSASKLHESGSFQDELKKYFSTFKSSDDLVSRAKSHFEEFASLRREPSCSECKKLGEYLSPGFDWNTKRDKVERYLQSLIRNCRN
ncbi:hypothetical protein OS493_000821 [Desmophyllum pertusum]|uniref:RNA-dependent RNA polymerase n=1 Tax=Desmophyllum pertusum TaxID=174260 RepID=A0A9X0D5Q4_9CNID|nr:hypothetical protein OS493_000821 [Desmophyllum pertusum]